MTNGRRLARPFAPLAGLAAAVACSALAVSVLAAPAAATGCLSAT